MFTHSRDPENRTASEFTTENNYQGATAIRGTMTWQQKFYGNKIYKQRAILALAFGVCLIGALILCCLLAYLRRRKRRYTSKNTVSKRVRKLSRWKRSGGKGGRSAMAKDFLAPSIGFTTILQEDVYPDKDNVKVTNNTSGVIFPKMLVESSPTPGDKLTLQQHPRPSSRTTPHKVMGVLCPIPESLHEAKPPFTHSGTITSELQEMDKSVFNNGSKPNAANRCSMPPLPSSANRDRLRDSSLLFPSESSLSHNGDTRLSNSSSIASPASTDTTNGASPDFAFVTENFRTHSQQIDLKRPSILDNVSSASLPQFSSSPSSTNISKRKRDSPSLAAEIYESEYLLQQRLNRMHDSQSLHRNVLNGSTSTTYTDDTVSERSVY